MNDNFNFLVIGAGRGGTSLIMALLDFHSKLELISEYNSVKYLMGKGIDNESRNNVITNRIKLFVNSCHNKASEHPNKQWGNKITTEQLRGLTNQTSENYNNIDIFDTFFNQHLKNQKKIFILRDGRNCATSKVNRTNTTMLEACDKWNYSVEVYKYLKNDQHSLCIKFEDLINTPILTLMEITKFLEISFEEKMLEGVLNKKLATDYQNKSLIKEKSIPTKIEAKYFDLIQENLDYCGYITNIN